MEIDFYLNNNVLVEVKFEEEIKDRQKEFFEKFRARHKRVTGVSRTWMTLKLSCKKPDV